MHSALIKHEPKNKTPLDYNYERTRSDSEIHSRLFPEKKFWCVSCGIWGTDSLFSTVLCIVGGLLSLAPAWSSMNQKLPRVGVEASVPVENQ